MTKHQLAVFKTLFKPAALVLDSSFFYTVSSSTPSYSGTLRTPTKAHTSRFPHTRMDFLAFPLEIRCLIYHYYGIRRCIRPFRKSDKQTNQATADEIAKCINIVSPALLLSCRQIHDEALPIIRKRHTMLLPSTPFAVRCLRIALEKRYTGFQSLHLLVTTPDLEAANSAVTDAVCLPLNPAFCPPIQRYLKNLC